MTRYGAVIVFKKELSKAQIAKAMRALGPMVELQTGRYENGKGWIPDTDPAQLVKSYNDELGGPVWYVP